jgi:hypothetical protein
MKQQQITYKVIRTVKKENTHSPRSQRARLQVSIEMGLYALTAAFQEEKGVASRDEISRLEKRSVTAQVTLFGSVFSLTRKASSGNCGVSPHPRFLPAFIIRDLTLT